MCDNKVCCAAPIHRGLDISGCILVSMVNAIGGGTLRDMALDRHPLFWMTDIIPSHRHHSDLSYSADVSFIYITRLTML